MLWTNILHQEIYLQDKNGETAVRSQVDTMHYNGQWVKEEAKTLIRLTLHDKRVEVYQLIKIKDHQIIVWNSKNNLTYCFVK